VKTFEFLNRHSEKLDRAMLVFGIGLFSFCLLDWTGVIAYDGYQPKRMVFLSGSLLIMNISSVVRPKFHKTSLALLVMAAASALFSLMVQN
jgi:hypothetical protein